MDMDKPYYALTVDQVLQRCSSGLRGLSSSEAKRRLETFGPNVIGKAAQEPLWEEILEILAEPMVLLLIGAMIIFFLLGERRDAIAMLLAIVPIVGIEFIQEYRTARAIRALSRLVEPRARVLRNGTEDMIASHDVVPGDILLLRAGDLVTADARLIETNYLAVDESLLTGESTPIDKHAQVLPDGTAIPERLNMAFAGTKIVEGAAKAIVVATGQQTEYGTIGQLTLAVKAEKTPLERKARQLTRWLALFGGEVTIAVVCIGILQGAGLLPAILRGLAVAMAAIPEELPVIFTVFLALGVWHMARQQALLRKIHAVEALGSVTTICVDKTGTLTQGELTIAKMCCDGQVVTPSDRTLTRCQPFFALPWLLRADPYRDPFEQGIEAFLAAHPEIAHPTAGWQVVQEYPFDPRRKRRSTLLSDAEGRWLLLTRGAPEYVLEICRAAPQEREWILRANTQVAQEGLRVLAYAHRVLSDVPSSRDDIEMQLVFDGLIGFDDAIREAVPAAIRQANDAGVRVVMITGDQEATALVVAGTLGLDHHAGVMTGQELERLSDEALRGRLGETSIFTRVLPAQKLRIVQALKARGEIVAMTGDGINDAPALRAADIGIAMGQRGTEIAREAATMVLLDDNFATIITAIREGRRIYANIQKAITYFTSAKIALLGFVLLNGFLTLPLALLPLHIVWMELIIDPTSSLVYQAEPAAPDLLTRKPRSPKEPLLSKRLLAKLVSQGLTMLAGTFVTYWWALHAVMGELKARTLAFSVLVLGQLFLVLVNRSERLPLWRLSLTSNPFLLGIILFIMLTQGVIVYWPPIQRVFRTTALMPREWLLVLGIAAASTLWFELFKWIVITRHGHRPADSQPEAA